MRSLPAALTNILEATEATDLVVLVYIDASTPLRYALWHSDVTFGGSTYTATNGAVSEFRHGVDGERPNFQLTLQNVTTAGGTDHYWSTYLQSTDLNGTEVRVYVTSPTALASDSTAYMAEQRWYISGWSLDHEWVRFRVAAPFDALELECPRQPLVSDRCAWTFKESPCTCEDDDFDTCPKTLEACMRRHPAGAPLPFGPSFPLTLKNGGAR